MSFEKVQLSNVIGYSTHQIDRNGCISWKRWALQNLVDVTWGWLNQFVWSEIELESVSSFHDIILFTTLIWSTFVTFSK